MIHIDSFLPKTMQKVVFTSICCTSMSKCTTAERRSLNDTCMLYYMRKYPLIVNSFIMRITFGHKPCLEPWTFNFFYTFLLSKHSFATNRFCFLSLSTNDQVPFFFNETISSLDASTRFSQSRSSNVSSKLPRSGLAPSFTIHISINIFIFRINVIVLQLRKNMLFPFGRSLAS